MTTNSSVKVGVALAVVALLALAMWSFDSTEEPSASTAGERPVASSAPAPLESADEPFADATQTPSTRAPIAEVETPPPELVVTVVDEATALPTPYAVIYVERGDLDDHEKHVAYERYGYEVPQIAERLGSKWICDATGVARVPRPKADSTIWARAGGAYGQHWVDAADGEVVVVVAATVLVHVEVVDARGRLASDVTLQLFDLDFDCWCSEQTTTTDENGRAVFTVPDDPDSDEPRTCRIAAALVTCEPEFVEFTRHKAPREVQRFVIGETASVELHIAHANGERVDLPARLDLFVDSERNADLPFGLAHGSGLLLSTRDGRARFERIGLSVPLVADACDEEHEFTERRFDAPDSAGAVVSVAVPIKRAHDVLKGRLVDLDGNPVTECCLNGGVIRTFSDGRTWIASVFRWVTPEPDGCFLHHAATEDGLRMGVRLQLTAQRDSRRRGFAIVVAPPPILEGERVPRAVFDFGDVVMKPVSAFVCGTVLDSLGHPVSTAEVRLLDPYSTAGPALLGKTRSESNGSFEIEFDGDYNTLTMDVFSKWHANREQRVVHRGQRDLIVCLGETIEPGAIRGKLLLPEGADGQVLGLSLEGDAGNSASALVHRASSGEFLADRVLPGTYVLRVDLHGQELALVGGIEVAPSKTTTIEPIDLRERVHAIAVRVRAAAGAPIRAAKLSVLDEDSEVSSVETDAKGLATLTSLSTSHELLISAVGFRPRVILGATSGLEVVLEPGVDVQFRRPDLGEAARDFELHLELNYLGPELPDLHLDPITIALPSDSPTLVRLPFAGRYELVGAKWIHRITGAEWPLELPVEPPVAVVGERTVLDERAELTLDWPTAALLEALDRARPK
jgi:hypothetical protein